MMLFEIRKGKERFLEGVIESKIDGKPISVETINKVKEHILKNYPRCRVIAEPVENFGMLLNVMDGFRQIQRYFIEHVA
ncbi:MAG: hypothetical protein Q8R12_03305 [bacterium]|nr:hypothetical protein [bacterium]